MADRAVEVASPVGGRRLRGPSCARDTRESTVPGRGPRRAALWSPLDPGCGRERKSGTPLALSTTSIVCLRAGATAANLADTGHYVLRHGGTPPNADPKGHAVPLGGQGAHRGRKGNSESVPLSLGGGVRGISATNLAQGGSSGMRARALARLDLATPTRTRAIDLANALPARGGPQLGRRCGVADSSDLARVRARGSIVRAALEHGAGPSGNPASLAPAPPPSCAARLRSGAAHTRVASEPHIQAGGTPWSAGFRFGR